MVDLTLLNHVLTDEQQSQDHVNEMHVWIMMSLVCSLLQVGYERNLCASQASCLAPKPEVTFYPLWHVPTSCAATSRVKLLR